MSYIGQTGMARIDHKNMLNLQQAKHLLISSRTLLSNRNRDVTYRNIPAISLVQHLAFKYFV